MKRLVDGDETGAITAACGAVDTLMQQLYAAHGLGDPANVAFAAKVNTAAQRIRIFEDMTDELTSLGIKCADADGIVTDMRKGTNHAAQMLQTSRRTMGDVHGSSRRCGERHTTRSCGRPRSADCSKADRPTYFQQPILRAVRRGLRGVAQPSSQSHKAQYRVRCLVASHQPESRR